MKILLECHVYNRKKITEICFEHINKYRDHSISDLKIVNDHSTEYDNEWLKQFTPNVVSYPKKETINVLMYRAFKEFLDTDYTHFYNFDNDAVHDPSYFDMLIKLHQQSKGLPVTLYKSSYVASFPNACVSVSTIPNGIIRAGVYGGISVFLSRENIENIVKYMPPTEDPWRVNINPGWDSLIQGYMGNNKLHATPEMSYVEHYGFNGQNHSLWTSDYAINPTPYLKSTYSDIRKTLENEYK